MILNQVEFALMNNPVRAAIQRRFEPPKVLRKQPPVPKSSRVTRQLWNSKSGACGLHEANRRAQTDRMTPRRQGTSFVWTARYCRKAPRSPTGVPIPSRKPVEVSVDRRAFD